MIVKYVLFVILTNLNIGTGNACASQSNTNFSFILYSNSFDFDNLENFGRTHPTGSKNKLE